MSLVLVSCDEVLILMTVSPTVMFLFLADKAIKKSQFFITHCMDLDLNEMKTSDAFQACYSTSILKNSLGGADSLSFNDIFYQERLENVLQYHRIS